MPAFRSSPKIIGRLGLALAVALVAPMGAAARQDDLAAVRQATAGFHDVDAALAAGYELGYVNGAHLHGKFPQGKVAILFAAGDIK